jgi:hypothetical protein
MVPHLKEISIPGSAGRKGVGFLFLPDMLSSEEEITFSTDHLVDIMCTMTISALNVCAGSPCGNNATCTITNGSYVCNCLNGWMGRNCTEGTAVDFLIFIKPCFHAPTTFSNEVLC